MSRLPAPRDWYKFNSLVTITDADLRVDAKWLSFCIVHDSLTSMANQMCNKSKNIEKGKGRHCCSVGELKITFASTCNHGCKESVFNVLFNMLFLVLDFPLGAPNTLLKHVIERSIWRIVVGEGSWWGWGFSQDW